MLCIVLSVYYKNVDQLFQGSEEPALFKTPSLTIAHVKIML